MDLLQSLSTWQMWLIAATALLILEIITPGFVLACFGLGCIGAMLTSLIGLGMAWQLAAFSLISVLSLFLLRPILMRRLEHRSINTGVNALIGRQIRLRQDIPREAEYSELSIDGDVWRAREMSGAAIASGTMVEIVGIEGLILIIKAID